MDKKQIKKYASDEEISQKLPSFEGDWSYNILKYSARHKTGLELCLEQDAESYQMVTSGNFSKWAHHMSHNEKLSAREIHTYQMRLIQEFMALSERNSQKVKAIDMSWPYLMGVSRRQYS